MANKIVLKKSSVAAKVPLSTDLEVGEIAVNLEDQKLYSKKSDGTVIVVGSGISGSGDVVGPASSTDNALVRFDSTTGKLIQNGNITQDDNGNLANVNAITLDTTPNTPPTTEGTLYWDTTFNTAGLVMKGGNVIQEIGESQFFEIKASAAITKGQVIMFTGTVGASGVITGAPATGVTDGTYIVGIAAESIANNGFGLVQTFGVLKGLNTSAYNDGDVLWYDPSVAGGLTATKPSAPNIKVQMAAVIRAGSGGSGTIIVRISAGSTLGGTDSNAEIGTPSNGQILSYDGTNSYWKNTTLTAGTAISVTPSSTGVLTIANTAPDQVVSLTGAGTTSVSGTYPNFTITSNDQYAGTVTSIGGTGTVNGITLSGTVTSTGNLTLGGTLSGISLTTQVSGTLPIANGGTNATTAADARTNLDVPTRTGGDASGTWGINVTGNSATATALQTARTINGVSFNGTANITVADSTKLPLAGGTMTGLLATVTNNAAFTSAIDKTLSIRGNASYGAVMSFHRPGVYAVNLGLDTDNIFKLGGWSASGVPHYWDMSGNAWATSSMRAPIFYDSNNTGYYCDPSGTSRFASLTVGVGSAYSLIQMVDDESPNGVKYVHANGNQIGFLSGGGGWILRADNNGITYTEQIRAQIFYDTNNTSYYLDPTFNSYIAYLYVQSLDYWSDDRLKIKQGNITNALDKVCALDAFYYTPSVAGIKHGMKDQITIGLSANNVLKVLPELVDTSNHYLSLDYARVTALLIAAQKEARQEFQSQIDNLKLQVEKLVSLIKG
jgi:hypothetical protein